MSTSIGSWPKGQRTNHACASCRSRKARCDGKMPACSSCTKRELECVYGELKRRGKGKTHAYIQSLEQRLDKMETLLTPSRSVSDGASSEAGGSAPELGESLDEIVPELEATMDAAKGVTLSEPSESITGQAAVTGLLSHVAPTSLSSGSHEPDRNATPKAKLKPPPALLQMMSTATTAIQLRDSMRLPQARTSRPVHAHLPPPFEARALIRYFLEDINPYLPIFQNDSIMALLSERFPVDQDSEEPGWWATINAIYGTGLVHRLQNGEVGEFTKVPWAYFKNAFSVYSELASVKPSIPRIQALLAIARFLNETADTRTAPLVVSTAVHMIRMLGLDQEDNSRTETEAEAEQRRQIYWVARILDTESSIKGGLRPTLGHDECDVELPSGRLVDGIQVAPGHVLPHTAAKDIFNLRAKLSVIQARAHTLSLSIARGRTKKNIREELQQLHEALEAWRRSVPEGIRPRCDGIGTYGVLEWHVASLHLAFYACADLMYRMKFKVEALALDVDPVLLGTTDTSTRPLSHYAGAARATLGMMDHMDLPTFVDTWRAFYHLLCAAISLLTVIAEAPSSLDALSDILLLRSLVRYVTRLRLSENHDIGRLMGGLTLIAWAAETALAQANNCQGCQCISPTANTTGACMTLFSRELIQDLVARLSQTVDFMQLTQGLVGNVPRLNDAACAVFSRTILQAMGNPECEPYLFSPDSLRPSTYGFGVVAQQTSENAPPPTLPS
ncbi:hypothetical protein GQ53DRAFT_35445 [Thozetella sp. PMI_491]|nr:hypothetical protein GQ53DRAFT_35445 [Thozetella sp. PMI_491]